eukprot:TRINITY_DN14418_c0_g2_i1.p1 TRINITY_DN14418_c0_g2~~TRINITY_DN14418_c0_g2_i1.p1  ORF type:complete len:457 (+),score=105.03 TRINITY_DN14418_c0_g2_i1:69-1439(+)
MGMEGAAPATSRQRPFVVVLTGGPSSGKSSALALLRDRLSTRGFQVLTIPEMATHLLVNSDGFQPEWVGTEKQVQIQRLFIDFQLSQEEAFTELAQMHPTKRPVLVLDSCTLNPKVYLNDEQWQRALNFPGKAPQTEEALLARYDLIIHMVTSAHGGNYEWGPGSNNPGRFHSREEAQKYDKRALEVFGAHPQLRVVPQFDDFEDKIGKVVEFVNDALHVEGLAGKRRRRKCLLKSLDELSAVVQSPTTFGAVVSSTFLDDDMQHSVRMHARISGELWLEEFQRTRSDPSCKLDKNSALANLLRSNKPVDGIEHATQVTYERRDKVLPSSGFISGKPCLTRKVITPEDYYIAIDSCSKPAVSTKVVLRFLVDSSYYELYFNLNSADLILDFAAEASEQHPQWLELNSSKDLTRENSETMVATAGVRGPCEASGQAPAKRQRFLRAHSTEEDALVGV